MLVQQLINEKKVYKRQTNFKIFTEIYFTDFGLVTKAYMFLLPYGDIF